MQLTRRNIVQGLLATASTAAFPFSAMAQDDALLTRAIPSSGEKLPLVGLGTWITFNVGNDPKLLKECTAVMQTFFRNGGQMIDSSPMYGSSQPTVGYGLKQLGNPDALFSAEKVWTSDVDGGAEQMAESRREWGVPQFDLMQVHNLVAWQGHLPRLFATKEQGQLRYVGVTTSHGRRHSELERIMASQPIDFIQVTYNAVDREVEQRILPLAQERGIAVIVNRPFRGGSLVKELQRDHPLPDWAGEAGAANWPQLLLKFIVSHPAITCAIPATTQPEHARENMGASRGTLPDEALRKRIAEHVRQL